ncbi:MAG TPA: O-antigen ligase family protein [Verrucomicrobiae bacterium]|nr:O-antigen ligase family protein [Verrucomicrobiae bacterium]
MPDRISKALPVLGLGLGLSLFVVLAYLRPGYFTSPSYLGALILLECLVVSLWLYRRIFFPIVILTFLFAGTNLPLGGIWTSARWFFLAAGALVGSFIMLKEHRHHFGLFHVLAAFAALAGLVSAVVSKYPGFALLKAVSLVLLFLYASTGARLAVLGRENNFFNGLLLGSEVFVGVLAAFYLVGIEAMGNPNSLGAVMGVVAAPLLLWGSMLEEKPMVHLRRQVLFVVAMYLTFHSQSRSGLAAALLSCGLLCFALRRYKLLGHGIVVILILVTASAIFDPVAFSKTVSMLTERVVYKDKDPTLGLFESRQTPWQSAVDSIHKHFWLGSGFGTTDKGQDASRYLNQSYGHFSSNESLTTENGSSYLTIITWVGVLGVAPFLVLLLALVGNVLRTLWWMRKTGNPSHPAVPLAIIMVAGLIHAGFEDWLFAVGYYLCVFYWSLAFPLADLAPSVSFFGWAVRWRSAPVQRGRWLTPLPANDASLHQ